MTRIIQECFFCGKIRHFFNKHRYDNTSILHTSFNSETGILEPEYREHAWVFIKENPINIREILCT